MINCIAIDDEPMALGIMEDYIKRSAFLELKASFRVALEALDYLQDNSIDLIFLDINMPDFNGIQFVKSLPSPRPEIIFCTAYSEYAAESYDYEAADYLLKPIEFERFIKSSLKAKQIIERRGTSEKSISTTAKSTDSPDANRNYVMIKTSSGLSKILLDDIIHIKATGNYINIHTPFKKIMSLQSMNDIMRVLPAEQFIRVHKSHIVSFKFIENIEPHQVSVGTLIIPVGSTYRSEFKKWIEKKM